MFAKDDYVTRIYDTVPTFHTYVALLSQKSASIVRISPKTKSLSNIMNFPQELHPSYERQWHAAVGVAVARGRRVVVVVTVDVGRSTLVPDTLIPSATPFQLTLLLGLLKTQ